MHFDAATGKVKCDYCDSTFTIEEVKKSYEEKNQKAREAAKEAAGGTAGLGADELRIEAPNVETAAGEDWGSDASKLKVYNCGNCGAQLITDETTAATTCPYCGNPTIIPGQFSAGRKPDYVIPFACEKEQAMEKLQSYYKGKKLLPKSFTSGNHLEEIKGVYADLERIEEPVPVHLAQAMCYAWIYGSQNKLKKIRICMTYVSLETETEKKFMEEYTLEELRDWFMNLISEYERWSDFQVRWTKKRNESVHGLEFPFPYRKGQHELVVDIYRTILRKKQLFVQAPTGIGKTMSAVFPAVHALGEKKADKIFYLTARTITRTVVEEAFLILRAKGVSCKSITITAKEKMCILDEPDCNPAS